MIRIYTIIIALVLSVLNILALNAAASDLKTQPKDTLQFYDGQNFTIIGKFHNENNYVRFPRKYKEILRPEVWELGQNSAGISIRFCSNASDISVKWTLMSDNSFPHMAPTGIKGVDLYTYENGAWQFVQTGRPLGKSSEYSLLRNAEPVFREYLLNLPLYDGVESLSIGINSNAEISRPRQPYLINKRPVVYYGTSIAQGGCASRPGMAFTNILSRKLDRSFINFGFSGQGTIDKSVGEAMSEIDAALYVIDCNPNTGADLIYDRTLALVKILKNNKPDIPVLLVENYFFENSGFSAGEHANEIALRQELRNAFEELKKSGLKGLYYQGGDGLVGSDHEGTLDGIHPNDLGMMRIADGLYPHLKRILRKDNY